MRTKNVQQGSAEWKALREKHYRTASSAAAMKGKSKYQKRSALVEQVATGISEDLSDKESLFRKGHDAEAKARPIAEEIVGDELFPATGLSDDEYLLASFDGITMLEDACWEHKLINDELRHATVETLDEHYKLQMDQQLAVSGAEKCLFMASDGTKEDCNWFWYERDEGRIAALRAGWAQFDRDVADYAPEAKAVKVEAAPVDLLPSVTVTVEGSLAVRDDFDRFESALKLFVGKVLIRDPQTDQDFANLENQVKALKKAEDALDAAEAQLLAQVEEVNTAKQRKDMLHELARSNRLMAEKLVKEQKKVIKMNMAQAGRESVDAFIAELNAGLGGNYLPQIATNYNEAMKAKRTIESLKSATDDETARAKIEASTWAEKIRANLKTIDALNRPELFADKAQLALKEPADLALIADARITQADAAEQKRRADEEQRKADAAAAEERRIAQERDNQEAERIAQAELATAEAEQKETSTKAPAVVQAPIKKRPEDWEIIGVVADSFDVHESVAIDWLRSMSFPQQQKTAAR